MSEEYLTLAELAEYWKLSVRQLRKYMTLPPGAALPCFRLGRSVRFRRHECDTWLAQFRTRGPAAITRVMRELGLDPERVPEVRKPLARAARPPAPARRMEVSR